jgi:ketosteroid isomerase-like protein
MNDNLIRHIDDDGSIYAAEIVPPEGDGYGAKYHVDLVRTSVDDYGLGREQRLTVGQYASWMEAEEHLHEVEDGLAESGLASLGEDVQRLREQPFEAEVFYLTAVYPPEAEGSDRATAQLLAIGESSISTARLTAGERDSVEAVIDRVDVAFAEAGMDAGLAFAQQEADLNGAPPATRLFDPDDGAVRHVDGGGTAHWFAVVERDEPEGDPYELRYFRALEMDDGSQRGDSYPVMPLPDDDPASAWPLRGLEMYLEKGDVYMAQQFAHDVADSYGQDFPEPLDLPALDPRPEYYFGYGVGPSNSPSLEAVKTWMVGAERRFDTLTINEYDSYEDAAVDEYILNTALATDGVEKAMNIAERWAVDNGYLDPKRDDPRIFFEDDAPDDPFTTHRERELAEPQYSVGAISANGEHFLDVMKIWGATGSHDDYERLVIPQPTWEDARLQAETAFTLQANGDLQGAMHLVEQAGVDAGVIDPERDDPRLFTHGPPDPFTTIRQAELAQETEITLNDDFDTEAFDADVPGYPALYRELAEEAEREREANAMLEGAAWFEATFAKSDTELLQPIDDTVNYAVVVQDADPWTVELAVEKYWKEPNGYIGISSVTLDTYDPDTGRELAERDREALMLVHDERGLEGLMHKAELTAMEHDWLDADRDDPRLFRQGPPDRFETLAQQLEGETIPEPEAVENPYWRMETLPVNDPDGEPLGHALHMVVYPHIEHDPERVGTPVMPEDEPFRMLEMAHFETTEAADRFGKEFNGYLMPGLLEGPELAQEVARLEGLPIEWKTLEGDDLTAYRNADLTLIRDPADWHPYNPNAERDARIATEGLYTDPIQGFVKLDEDEKPKVEPVSPDFDL